MIINKLLIRIGTFFKGEPYLIDKSIPTSSLIQYIFSKLFSLIRCLIYGVVISINPKNLVFIEKRVSLSNKRFIHFGKGVSIGQSTIIDGLSQDGFHFGNSVSIGAYSIIRATGVLNSLGKGFYIGNNSSMDAYCFIGASGGVFIGNDVIIGQRVSFHSENHNFDGLDMLIREQGITRKGIIVENNCWIGANVTLLDGAYVSSGCVVGAGSLVKGYIPKDSIVVGNPGRVIAKRSNVI